MNARDRGQLISDLSDYVGARMGLSFPRERWGDLERKIPWPLPHSDFLTSHHAFEWLLSSPVDKRKLEILSSCLTVGETFFFPGKKRASGAYRARRFPKSSMHMRRATGGCGSGARDAAPARNRIRWP